LCWFVLLIASFVLNPFSSYTTFKVVAMIPLTTIFQNQTNAICLCFVCAGCAFNPVLYPYYRVLYNFENWGLKCTPREKHPLSKKNCLVKLMIYLSTLLFLTTCLYIGNRKKCSVLFLSCIELYFINCSLIFYHSIGDIVI